MIMMDIIRSIDCDHGTAGLGMVVCLPVNTTYEYPDCVHDPARNYTKSS